jgi:hypothetical protein
MWMSGTVYSLKRTAFDYFSTQLICTYMHHSQLIMQRTVHCTQGVLSHNREEKGTRRLRGMFPTVWNNFMISDETPVPSLEQFQHRVGGLSGSKHSWNCRNLDVTLTVLFKNTLWKQERFSLRIGLTSQLERFQQPQNILEFQNSTYYSRQNFLGNSQEYFSAVGTIVWRRQIVSSHSSVCFSSRVHNSWRVNMYSKQQLSCAKKAGAW